MASDPGTQVRGTRIAVALTLLATGAAAVIALAQLGAPAHPILMGVLWAIMGACLAASALFFALPLLYKLFGCTSAAPNSDAKFTSEGLGWNQLAERKHFKTSGTKKVAAGFQVIANVWPKRELPQPILLRLHFSADVEHTYAHLYPDKTRGELVTIEAKLSGPDILIDLSESHDFKEGSKISVVTTSKVSGCRFRRAERQIPT